MTYIADGDIGTIRAIAGTAPDGAHADIDSTKVIDHEQTISLLFPTILDFTTITWKIRFPVNFNRAFMDKNMKEQQPDAVIDGWTGYARAGDRYFFVDEDNEWFEAHGGVDSAWWQFLFIGLGQALFTDGEFSVVVDIEENAFYYVSMLFNPTLAQVTLSLADHNGNVLGTNVKENIYTFLVSSNLGATGKVYNLVGDTIDATDNFTLLNEREPYQRWYRNSTTGYVLWGGGGVGGDTVTHDVGSCAGVAYSDWVRRPYWAECSGRLDNTFYDNHTNSNWYEFSCDIDPPEGYDYIIWEPRLSPDNQTAEWQGKSVVGLANNRWPGNWLDGEVSGLHVYEVLGEQSPKYASSVSNFRSDKHIFFGVEPDAASWAEMPPWYTCGGGWDWPWLTGAGDSWLSYAWGDNWTFRWAESVDEGEDFEFDIDWISLADTEIGVLPENNDLLPMEGWNTEMVSVVDGYFSIGGTPVRGSVNVYSYEGELLDYGDEWLEAEADDEYGPGRRFQMFLASHEIVVVVYFLTKPVLGNDPSVSRPTEEQEYQERPRATRTPMPM